MMDDVEDVTSIEEWKLMAVLFTVRCSSFSVVVYKRIKMWNTRISTD